MEFQPSCPTFAADFKPLRQQLEIFKSEIKHGWPVKRGT